MYNVIQSNILYLIRKESDKSADLFPNQETWEEWIQSGNDSNSLWVNPQFQDHDEGLYTLKEQSPAWSLGIKQIELNNFGVQDTSKYHV